MKKYIDANEAITVIDRCKNLNIGNIDLSEILNYRDGLQKAINKLNEMPAADVVEVIRCKDCKYRKKYIYGNQRDYCEKCSTLEHTEYVNLTDFCSKGKRREINEG